MSSYGRNGLFLVSPHNDQRASGVNSDVVAIPNFVPVISTGAVDSAGRKQFTIAKNVSGEIAPVRGLSGIAIYEGDPWNEYSGYDPVLTVPEDIDNAPVGFAFTVQEGAPIKVRLINTVTTVFGNVRTYNGRTMVAGLGATPSVTAGAYLTPGVGNDASGYWAQTVTAGNAWLRVTSVDPNGVYVDAVAL